MSGCSRAGVRSAVAGVLAMVLVLVLALGLALAGCGTASAAKAVGGREGQALPAVTFTTIDGRTVDLAAQRGKVVIVDFWDTWCGPCLKALPHLQALGTAHPDSLVVVAVAIGQEGEGKVRQVVAGKQLTMPVAMLGSQPDLVPAFGDIDALPTTFLVGPDGVIRKRWVGAQALASYERAVSALLRP